MRIYNATYQNVIIDWANATLPIREGSPISADGKVSNDSDAIGLCPRYIWQEPIEDKNVPILIGGDVVLPEVEAEYGESLTDDAIASMGGINFYDDDGSIDKESGGGGGGDYDLILTIDTEEPILFNNLTVSDIEVIKGSIADCVAMLENNRTLPKVQFVFNDGNADSSSYIVGKTDVYEWDFGYGEIRFRFPTLFGIVIFYNDTTYEITDMELIS